MLNKTLAILLSVAATSAFAQETPRIVGLPALEASDPSIDQTALTDLGRMLFFDARLSGDGSTSCAECHSPSFGFGDGSDLSRGYPGTKHWRNSQTLVNSAYLTEGLHWDGSVQSFMHQVPGAMSTSFAANIDTTMAEERLRQIPGYVEQFQNIWQSQPDMDKIATAIAAYEKTLISADSPFDRFVGGDFEALSKEAADGLQVFAGKGNCTTCHQGALATDQKFHNTSVPRNAAFQEDPLRQVTFRAAMRGFGVKAEIYEALDRDPGLFAATGKPEHLGAFRTAPLRYLKYTAPYMHNGAFYTLEEVVDFYNDGGTPDFFGTKSPEIKPLGLTDQEKSALVAFLESLSGTEILEDIPTLPEYEVIPAPSNPITASMLISGGYKATPPAKPADVIQASVAVEPVLKANEDIQSGLKASSAGLTILGSDGQVAQLDAGNEIVVLVGDTLGTIAKRELGDLQKYRDILDANRDRITNPNVLTPGMKLRRP